MPQWLAATEGKRSAHCSTLTKERDRPDTYVQIVEFPSHEEAMEKLQPPRDSRIR